jgi:hypothetical protein
MDTSRNFLQFIKQNGLALAACKVKLFQGIVIFLVCNIYQGSITPNDSVIQLIVHKFSVKIKDKINCEGL